MDSKRLTLEYVFIRLRLMSKLEINDKLIISDDYINIDKSYIPSITRSFHNANRKATNQYLDYVLKEAFQYSDELIEESNTIQLLRLMNELKNSLTGLANLKSTYNNDKLIQSELEVMTDNIATKIRVIEDFIDGKK